MTARKVAKAADAYDYDNLMRALAAEIKWTTDRARHLRGIKADIRANRRKYTPDGWSYVGQRLGDLLTHRNNIYPQTMIRSVTMLAARAGKDVDADAE